jgi:hypothetical protein
MGRPRPPKAPRVEQLHDHHMMQRASGPDLVSGSEFERVPMRRRLSNASALLGSWSLMVSAAGCYSSKDPGQKSFCVATTKDAPRNATRSRTGTGGTLALPPRAPNTPGFHFPASPRDSGPWSRLCTGAQLQVRHVQPRDRPTSEAIQALQVAGVLCPVFGLLLRQMVAAPASSRSPVSVVGNALRLRGSRSLNRQERSAESEPLLLQMRGRGSSWVSRRDTFETIAR